MKKGFTLVELLAVIVILGIIATIVGVSVSGVIDTTEERTYEQQVKAIERAAKEWGVEHTEFLPYSGTCLISIDTLVSSGKLEGRPHSPIASGEMSGGVEVTFDDVQNQYVYEYKESSSLSLCNYIGEE